MPSLERLEIQNFKNLANITLDLKPLNILIGPNGGGKSNFLSVFHLFQRAMNEELNRTINAVETKTRKSPFLTPIRFSFKFNALRTLADDAALYRLEFSEYDNRYFLTFETLERATPQEGYTSPFAFFKAENGMVRFLWPKDSTENLTEDGYKPNEALLAQLRDPRRYPLMNELRQMMAEWTVFRGFGENALENIRSAQRLETVSPLRLDPQGKNLVSLLHTLRDEQPETYEALEEVLGSAFADFHRLRFSQPVSGALEIKWESKKQGAFSLAQVSDGMVRFLGLATLLILPQPPPLILIDEPEIGLHPRLIPVLADLLKSASQRTQVLVSTHAPDMLTESIGLEDVVLVDLNEERLSTMTRASDHPHLEKWLSHYSLANLWTMGRLESQR